ncbi:MAG: hypothetical protein HY465_04595, partial [Deltaproteobacteria bacterium]|nr:hypothetical protein [Deltaproteobacteria bacterium]
MYPGGNGQRCNPAYSREARVDLNGDGFQDTVVTCDSKELQYIAPSSTDCNKPVNGTYTQAFTQQAALRFRSKLVPLAHYPGPTRIHCVLPGNHEEEETTRFGFGWNTNHPLANQPLVKSYVSRDLSFGIGDIVSLS